MFNEVIYNCAFMIIFVCALAGVFYLFGRFFIKLLQLPSNDSDSFFIAVGMSSVTLCCYYANKLTLSLLYFCVTTFCNVMLFLVINYFKNRLQSPQSYSNNKLNQVNWHSGHHAFVSVYIFPLFVLLFTLQAMIAFRTISIPVGTIMNFDIFYWSLLAEHVFGASNFSHIIPGGEGMLNYFYIDGWGTSLILGLIGKLIKITSLEAASYYAIFFLSLIGLVIFEIIKKIFYFKNSIAFMLSFLTTGSTFLFFIAYNQFYAELAATFYYLVGIYIVIYITNKQYGIGFLQTILMITFPLLGIFLMYQSGFLVFSLFLICFCLLSISIQTFPKNQILTALRYFFLVFFVAIILVMCLLPEFALHMLHRTFFVLNIKFIDTGLNGWQMPLLSPFILFSIPELGILPDELNSQIVRYTGVVSILLLLLILAFKVTNRQTNNLYKNATGIIMLFCLSLAGYFILYSIKGNLYQVWKFAAFTILPVSFVFLSVLISPFYYSVNKRKFSRTILFILLLILCVLVVNYPFKGKKLYLYTEKITQFKIIKQELNKNPSIKNIVIAIPDDTQMIAINLFANDFKLFPLIKVHHFAKIPDYLSIRQLDPSKTVALVLAQCYPDKQNKFTTNQFRIISLSEFLSVMPIKPECLNLNRRNLLNEISAEWL